MWQTGGQVNRRALPAGESRLDPSRRFWFNLSARRGCAEAMKTSLRLTTLALAALAAGPLAAEPIDPLGRGESASGPPPVALTVDALPAAASELAARAPEIVSVSATPFYLQGANPPPWGPYAYRNGAPVELAGVTYGLVIEEPAAFFLTDPVSGRRLGPFAGADGAAVALPATNLTLVRLPSTLSGTLAHERLAASSVTLALVPVTPLNRAQLQQLGRAFVELTQRYGVETSPVAFEGLPTVRGLYGRDYAPIAQPSAADIARARRKADLGAKAAFRAFLSRAQLLTAVCGKDGRFRFGGLAAGAYVLCAMADVRANPSAWQGSYATVATWWVNLRIEAFQAVAVALTAENAKDWQELFTAAPNPDRPGG